MDLSSLSTTLPPGPQAELLENFRAAALSITALYKSSLNTSKHAYRAGYSSCLNDILQTLQASISSTSNAQHPQTAEEAGRTLGRLMDWIEARQEALKFEAAEEQEDQQPQPPSAGPSHPHPSRSHVDSARRQTPRQRDHSANSSSSVADAPTPGYALPSSSDDDGNGGTMDHEMEDVEQPISRVTSGEGQARPTMGTPRNSSKLRQRDALVNAINLHQQSRSSSVPTSSRTPRPTLSAASSSNTTTGPSLTTPRHALQRVPSSSPTLASSPITHPNTNTNTATIYRNTRPNSHGHHIKPLPKHPHSNANFAPDLPFLPIFNAPPSAADIDALNAFGFGPGGFAGAPQPEQRVGGKRPFESVGGERGGREGGGGKGRKRFGGGAGGGGEEGSGEERERKRPARRG